MQNDTRCPAFDGEEKLKALMDVIGRSPMLSPDARFELTAILTELLPSVRERNHERIHNLINVRRDKIICQIDADSNLPHNLKEHRKNGVRLCADALKWALDGMLFV